MLWILLLLFFFLLGNLAVGQPTLDISQTQNTNQTNTAAQLITRSLPVRLACVKKAVFYLCKLFAYMLVLANTRRRKDFKTIIYLASLYKKFENGLFFQLSLL